MALQQKNRLLNLNTVLGQDVLFLTSFSGSEEMGRLFRYQLDLISDDPSIKAQDIVGTPVSWSVELADNSRRHWHGFVNSLSRGDIDGNKRRNYRVQVVPWLWFLTQTSDCKIFQETKVPDIIDEVLGEYGFADYMPDFQLEHKDWEYCVQYRETDFNFLSRLMEQEGMFYYFKHSEGAHQMVITDHKDGYYTLPESQVDFPDDIGSRAIVDHLTSWERRYEFVPGKYAQRDYNFKTPSDMLQTDSGTVVDLPEISNFELYDYPGEYPDKGVGNGETRLRIEAEEARHDIVSATSLCKTFQVGGRFTVQQHRDSSEKGAEVVITSVQHFGSEPMSYETGDSGGFAYRNSFTCLPASRVFRTSRNTAKPIISGVQTAIITGPPGEEIFPDEFGRVKCQFHWDRYGENDDKSSCWIRVSQVHAGTGFGGISIPRIGEEVVVSFVEGDPDRPLITGRVYHAMNKVPFALPDSKNISGIKSNSTMGGGGYNEYVMDDTKGNELIREHGQFDKDSTIEHDLREHVLNNRTRDVSVDEAVSIGNNQAINVASTRTVDVGVDQNTTIGSNATLSIGSNSDTTIGADHTLNIGGSDTYNSGSDRSSTVGGSDTLNVASTLEIVAGSMIKLVVGGSVIEIGPAGIKITGPKVDVAGAGPVSIVGAVVKVNS